MNRRAQRALRRELRSIYAPERSSMFEVRGWPAFLFVIAPWFVGVSFIGYECWHLLSSLFS